MENQRVRLSKQLLKDALISLLEEKSLQKISVYEICDRAQINRTTFYKYYYTQQDLLNDIEKDILSELEQRLMADNLLNDGLGRIFSFFEDERKKCLMLINSTTDIYFAKKIFALPQLQLLVQTHMPKTYTEAQIRYIQTFIYHGGYAIAREWINSEVRETPEEISRLILMLMEKIIDTQMKQ